MILIIGSNHDDVLFYENALMNKKDDVILNQYPVSYGKIFNQDVAVVSEVYTNYISSIVTSYFINNYFVILVINVGTCLGYSDNVNFLDLAISDQVTLSDVDQIAIRPVHLGQIPGNYPSFFKLESELKSTVVSTFDTRYENPSRLATYFSANTYYVREEQLAPLKLANILSPYEKDIVFDCTYGGVALACYMHNISSVAIKVVEGKFTEYIEFERYAQILSCYASIGKSIMSLIGDISRTDILEGVVSDE